MAKYYYGDNVSFDLPSWFEYSEEENDDGETTVKINADSYVNDDGELAYKYRYTLGTVSCYDEEITPDNLIEILAKRAGTQVYMPHAAKKIAVSKKDIQVNFLGITISMSAITCLIQTGLFEAMTIMTTAKGSEDLEEVYSNLEEIVNSIEVDFEKVEADNFSAEEIMAGLEASKFVIDERYEIEPLKFESNDECLIGIDFNVPIPDGFHYSEDTAVISSTRKIVVVPEEYPLNGDPMEAPVGLTIQADTINVGRRFDPNLAGIYKTAITGVFTAGVEINEAALRDGFGILYPNP